MLSARVTMRSIAVQNNAWKCFFLFNFLFVVGASPALAIKKPNYQKQSILRSDPFTVTPFVSRQVTFWEAIFSRYPSSTVLIHDSNYPELILDIIDLDSFGDKIGRDNLGSRSQKERFCQRYLERYNLALKRFRQYGRKAIKFGAIEQRVYNVYRKNSQALYDLYKGDIEIRNQAGLSDEFKEAAVRAEIYLPHMEKIFANHNLPTDLTRLAFVESMFNTKAVSKVGASGIWQFMPKTARRYMYVSSFFDERNSPLKATRAAARVLRENFATLGQWSLAITAYNHGTMGIARGARAVGSLNFDKIIARYRARSFGFASKNFFAEFVAARNVYNRQFMSKFNLSKSLNITPIKIQNRMSIAQILRQTPIDKETLERHNPCIRPMAFKRKDYATLPLNYEIFVPTKLAPRMHFALARLNQKVSQEGF